MVSVIIPVFNEKKYIDAFFDSLLHQNYPFNEMEWIFVDGMSNDGTLEKINNYKIQYKTLIKVYKNVNRTQAYALNLGISKSIGDVIIRMDVHAIYDSDYISKCLICLQTSGADNVGGVIVTKAFTEKGNYISKILSSKFGVGNSKFRTRGSGYVDTVPFGAFKRDVFIRLGLFDTRLDRNEDNEFNYRIRKNGGRVFLSKDIHSVYYCRDNLKDLLKMARLNGKWNVISLRVCPKSMGLRHFAPLSFFSLLFVLLCVGIFFHIVWFFALGIFSFYSIVDLICSISSCDSFGEFWKLYFSFFLFHFNYALGSFLGIFSAMGKRFRKNNTSIARLPSLTGNVREDMEENNVE